VPPRQSLGAVHRSTSRTTSSRVASGSEHSNATREQGRPAGTSTTQTLVIAGFGSAAELDDGELQELPMGWVQPAAVGATGRVDDADALQDAARYQHLETGMSGARPQPAVAEGSMAAGSMQAAAESRTALPGEGPARVEVGRTSSDDAHDAAPPPPPREPREEGAATPPARRPPRIVTIIDSFCTNCGAPVDESGVCPDCGEQRPPPPPPPDPCAQCGNATDSTMPCPGCDGWFCSNCHSPWEHGCPQLPLSERSLARNGPIAGSAAYYRALAARTRRRSRAACALQGAWRRRRARGGLCEQGWGPVSPLSGAAARAAVVVHVARIRSSSGRRPGHTRGAMLVDSGASIDIVHDQAMFDEDTLETLFGDLIIETADGTALPATHTGTLQLEACDENGAWRTFQRPGACLVPGLRMNLLSVRASRQLGWPAPDFNSLVVHGPRGERFPISDTSSDYILASRIPTRARAEEAAAPTPAPTPTTDVGTTSPGRAVVRPWDSIRRGGHDDDDRIASVVVYENVYADDGYGGYSRSERCRQGRVLRLVTDATDDEISAAAAEGNVDQDVYWAQFGVGGAAYRSAIRATERFEADGVATRTGRLGGDRWRY
jgi:hypothetical protein